MKRSTVLLGAFEVGLMTLASIICAYGYLVFDRKASFAFSEFLEFSVATVWIYAFGALLMSFGNLVASQMPGPSRLLLLVAFGIAISYLCHVVLSIISWYWSMRLVVLVAATLVICCLSVAGETERDTA